MVQFRNNLLLLVAGVVYTSVYHVTLAVTDNSTTTVMLIGSNESSPLSPFDFDAFYLNTARPAQINGTINSLSYCYYGRRDSSADFYQSLVALYRSAGRSGYQRISETVVITKRNPTLQTSPDEVLLRGFNCDYYELSENVQVMEGDLIGACIFDTARIGKLDLLSVTSDGYSLLADGGNTIDCERGTLPMTIMGDILEGTRRRGILHVSAEIFPRFTSMVTIAELNANNITSLPPDTLAETGKSTSIFIIIVAVIGGLVFIAVIALIVVIIVVVCCLTMQKRLCDKKENINFGITENSAYTIASRQTVTPDRENVNAEVNDSAQTSLRSSQPYYDYILNSATRGIQLRANECDENGDCEVQENVAYSSPESFLKNETKSPSNDEYVMFIP